MLETDLYVMLLLDLGRPNCRQLVAAEHDAAQTAGKVGMCVPHM